MAQNYVQNQQYSPYIKPYVEGAHKEYADLQKQLRTDYDETTLQYDALAEAKDNMHSLDASGDIALKKEAFDAANKYIDDAAKSGDYENRGRIVRKAIKDFKTKYAPVAQQLADKQEIDKAIDERKDIPASMREGWKTYTYDKYKNNNGLKKDADNNYVGYSLYKEDIPSYIDNNKKLTEIFAGAIKRKYGNTYDEIIDKRGTVWDMYKVTTKLTKELFSKEQIDAMVGDTLSTDIEWQDSLKGVAKLQNYKKREEEILPQVTELIEKNISSLIEEDKQLGKNSKGLGKLSREELQNKSIEDLTSKGLLSKELTDKLENNTLEKGDGADYFMNKGYRDEISNIYHLAHQKFGQVQEEKSILHDETEALKLWLKDQNEAVKKSHATVLMNAGTLDLKGDANFKRDNEMLKNKATEQHVTFMNLMKANPNDPTDQKITFKQLNAAEELNAKGVDLTTKEAREQLGITEKQQFRLAPLIEARNGYHESLRLYENGKAFSDMLDEGMSASGYYNKEAEYKKWKGVNATHYFTAEEIQHNPVNKFKNSTEFMQELSNITADKLRGENTEWLDAYKSRYSNYVNKVLNRIGLPHGDPSRDLIAVKYLQKAAEDFENSKSKYLSENKQVGVNLRLVSTAEGSNIYETSKILTDAFNRNPASLKINNQDIYGALQKNETVTHSIGADDFNEGNTSIEIKHADPLLTIDGSEKTAIIATIISKDATGKEKAKAENISLIVDTPRELVPEVKDSRKREYYNTHFTKTKQVTGAQQAANNQILEFSKGQDVIKRPAIIVDYFNAPITKTPVVIDGDLIDYVLVGQDDGSYRAYSKGTKDAIGKVVGNQFIEGSYQPIKNYDEFFRFAGQQAYLTEHLKEIN